MSWHLMGILSCLLAHQIVTYRHLGLGRSRARTTLKMAVKATSGICGLGTTKGEMVIIGHKLAFTFMDRKYGG